MILAKARLVEGANGHVRVRLSFPTGFDPDEVIAESLLANGIEPPGTTHVDPRRGGLEDIHREFEACFFSGTLWDGGPSPRILRITGTLRRGLRFTAAVVLPAEADGR